MHSFTYDIIFLGGGPAGYEGAIAAAKKGLKAAVVEMDQLGGTCLQRGCIPTKAILHSIKLLHHIRQAAKIGIETGEARANTGEIVKRKTRVVQKLTRGIELHFKNLNIDLLRGRGCLTAPHTILVNGEKEITGQHIVLASGARPAELPFLKRDGRLVLHSDDLFALAPIPPKMLVIGAGAVGIEWAVIYQHLGSQVTVVEIMDHILPGTDGELTAILKTELQKQGITVHTATAITPELQIDGVAVTFKNKEKEWQDSFNQVLLSVGRLPNSDGITATELNLARDAKGFVKVNENLQTSITGVFACGDLVGNPQLAHKASHQAIAIVEFIVSGTPIQQHPIPAAVFTFPEVATVGLSEEEARKQNMMIQIGRFPYSSGSRANAVDEKTGLIKVIANEQGVIIGAHIVGAEAGELLPLLVHAVHHQQTAKSFKDLVFIHPTLGEGIWEALGAVGGFAIHI